MPITADGEALYTADLPDVDANGVIDVLEPNAPEAALFEGQVLTGLSGHGCVISASGAGSSDPLLPLLAFLAMGGVMVRRRQVARTMD